MSRLLAAAILAVFVSQALGVALFADSRCTEECEDDGPDGQCPPTCTDCSCCAHPRAVSVAPLAMEVPGDVRLVEPLTAEDTPPETDLADILRIPKRVVRPVPGLGPFAGGQTPAGV